MPNGKPDFDVIGANIPIKVLARTTDNAAIQTALYALVVDFCNSLNVKNTMSKSQCMECAAMLYDKCDMYRLEDYAVMFQMAKRGELIGTTYNKLDITDIAGILSAYDAKRSYWVERVQDEEFKAFESQINSQSDKGEFTIGEALAKSMKDWKEDKPLNTFSKDKVPNIDGKEILKQFGKNK